MNVLSLGVRSRIYGGFAIVVTLAVTLAGFAVWQLDSADTEVSRMGTIADNNARVLQISQTFEVIQRTYLQYKAAGDAAQITQAAEAEDKAIALLKAAQKEAQSDEQRRTYQQLESGIGELKASRETLVTAMTALKGNRDQLIKVGEDLTKVSDALTSKILSISDDQSLVELTNSLARSILLVRISSWQFQSTGDKSSQALFKTNFDAAAEALGQFDKLRTLAVYREGAGAIKKPLADYSKLFSDVSAAGAKTEEIFTNAVVPKLNQMGKTVHDVEAALTREFAASKSKTNATIDNITFQQEVATFLMLLLGAGVAWLISRSIVKPLTALTGAMRELAGGNFEVLLPGLGRRDELGEMAKAVDTFKVKAVEKAALENEERMAETRKLDAQRRDVLHKLAADFESAVGTVVGTVSTASAQLETAAHKLTNTAETTEQLVIVVADASQAASTNVQTVAAASEELATSVSEVGRQVLESSKIAGEAVEQARQTDVRINQLSQAASRIGDVVKLITAIAEQTNLLALNATIEAARAGEAGRGFAVVAQEVKALASQTAKATDEIGTQIASMQSATAESVTAIKEIGTTINRVSEIASAIAAAVEEQGVATQEIARNVQNAAQGTAQVATNIDDVRSGAKETGTASAQVLDSARALSAEGGRLKTEVGKFLATVRAA
jgi:methyl-accepting chemotaxis protein